MEDIKKRKKNKGNVWGVVFTNVFFFSSEFCAAVSAPHWEREQCLSEINTTQRERGKQTGRKGREKKGGRNKGRQSR